MSPSKIPGGKRTRKASQPNEKAAPATVPPPGTPAISLPVMDGSLPTPPPGAMRPRRELRMSCQHVFDTAVRTRLEHALKDHSTPLKDVLAIGDLYARVGVGFVGTNELDPADVASLPAPVITMINPDAPLPDGK